MVAITPSIEGKLHLKTEWNLSLWGDKYISVFTKLYAGVGCGIVLDGKFKDLFPAGLGEFTSIPIPATSPLFTLELTPDVFLRGEGHISARLSSPKLKAAIWSKLVIENWVPFMEVGFNNSDGEAGEPEGSNRVEAKMSLSGFVHGGLLFPLKVSSLPLIKKFFKSEIGGFWYVGPKVAADFTLDMTNWPWRDVAAYNQLKNITLSMHMLDADYEVKGTIKTAFSGEKNVTLADGSISLFPPFDATFVPEFGDPTDYSEQRWIGEKRRNCRVIAFRPSGFVVAPVEVGVALFEVKADGTIDYDDGYLTGAERKYYHFAQLLGQDLEKQFWPEVVLPYLYGRSTGSSGKRRAVPFVDIGGRILYSPESYDFEEEPMFSPTGDTFEVNSDGSVKKPFSLIGYIDKINTWVSGNYFIDDAFEPGFLRFEELGEANGKKTFTARVNMQNFGKYYNPADTLKYETTLAIHKQIDDDDTWSAPCGLKTFLLPNLKENPVLRSVKIENWSHVGMNISLTNPTASVTRFSRMAGDKRENGWHCALDYSGDGQTVKASFDMVTDGPGDAFHVANGTISFATSYEADGNVYSLSGSGTIDGVDENSHPSGKCDFADQFKIYDMIKGTYKQVYGSTVVKQEELNSHVTFDFGF